MAEEEEIIIIEEEEAAGVDSSMQDVADEKKYKKFSLTKKNIIIIASGTVFVIAILIMLIFIFSSKEKQGKESGISITQEQTTSEKIKEISTSQIEEMIKRANILYEQGDKDKALKLYEKIALYSESISYYNLGVSELKQKQYKKAVKSFDLAIKNNQNLCVSSLNAAVASLKLGKMDSFRRYINMAQRYLPKETSSKMYSYYYSLINYYKQNYLEALSPLGHRTTDNYALVQNRMDAKINILFSSYHKAIADLEKDENEEDSFTLGLLYANLGDSILAKKYLHLAIQQGFSPIKAQLALALMELKSGQISEAAKLIDTLTQMYPEKIYSYYPVETYLKESLFDVDLAQYNFHNNIIHNQDTIYQILFYFAPYKIFNSDKTISYIRKGNANISIDNISDADNYLSKSASVSSVNVSIAKSIQMALNFKLLEANEKLKKITKTHPNNSIVQYNLALTYAQLGDMTLAHKHFLKSHNLDAKNYLSGIFAMMSAKIINKENEKFNQILKENLATEPKTQEYNFYRALIHYKEQNFAATYAWMQKEKKDRILYLAFDILIAMSMDKQDMAKAYSEKLTKLLPNDILPHLIYIDTHYAKDDNKMFAREAIAHLKNQKFNMNDFYYGPFITQYLYILYAQVTGTLFPLKQQLTQKLNTETKNPITVMQALALVDIYLQDFEEAYTIYNDLIDRYKQQDSHTLFLASIAATGAKHPANAIALLEIAKRKNPNHNESRYALGLLYLQTKNNDGAVISFKHINEANFQSQYFNFKIVKKAP